MQNILQFHSKKSADFTNLPDISFFQKTIDTRLVGKSLLFLN